MKTIKLGTNGIRILEHLQTRKKELERKMRIKVIRLRRINTIKEILENEKGI
jgi:hypothetical protein